MWWNRSLAFAWSQLFCKLDSSFGLSICANVQASMFADNTGSKCHAIDYPILLTLCEMVEYKVTSLVLIEAHTYMYISMLIFIYTFKPNDNQYESFVIIFCKVVCVCMFDVLFHQRILVTIFSWFDMYLLRVDGEFIQSGMCPSCVRNFQKDSLCVFYFSLI